MLAGLDVPDDGPAFAITEDLGHFEALCLDVTHSMIAVPSSHSAPYHSQLKTAQPTTVKGTVGVQDEERAPLLDAPSLPGPHVRGSPSGGNLKL